METVCMTRPLSFLFSTRCRRRSGITVCGGTGDVVCNDLTTSSVELCNGVDDDCVNGIDDTFPIDQPCTVGLGACARTGVLECDTAMTGTKCSVTPGPMTAELCGNGADEDCNGADAARNKAHTMAQRLTKRCGGHSRIQHTPKVQAVTMPVFPMARLLQSV